MLKGCRDPRGLSVEELQKLRIESLGMESDMYPWQKPNGVAEIKQDSVKICSARHYRFSSWNLSVDFLCTTETSFLVHRPRMLDYSEFGFR